MSHVRSFSPAACVAVLLIAAGCGGATSPTTPTPSTPAPPPVQTTTVSYSGLFASGLFTGTVTMVAQVPVSSGTSLTNNAPLATASATGTAKFTGASTTTVNLTGTYDTVTGKFVLTSSGWNIDATVAANGVVTGTMSTPAGAAAVTAQTTTQTNPVVNYCGSYTGSEGGKFLVTVRGGLASGVAAENGQPGGIILAGSVNGSSISLSWSWTNDGVGSGLATGTIVGTTVSGTWSNTEGHSGTWSGSSGC